MMDTIADVGGMQGADGGERRRRTWSADQKQRIIAESFAPGASVAEVARRYGLNANMLFTWRRRGFWCEAWVWRIFGDKLARDEPGQAC